jgi:hypothetical protein
MTSLFCDGEVFPLDRDLLMGTSIWALRLFNGYCDICKNLRHKIPAIHSRYMQSELKAKTTKYGLKKGNVWK